MRKALLLAAIVIFSLASVAQAETVNIGGKNMHFNVPSGYVPATGGKYAQLLAMMRQAQPKDIYIFAMYLPKDLDETLRNSDTGSLDRYVTLSYSRQLLKQQLSTRDFGDLKEALGKMQGKLNEGEIASQVNQAIARVGTGDIRVGSIKPLGTFGETKTSFSFMALITQSSVVDGKRVPLEMGLVSTQLLTEGKVVMVNQYAVIQSPEDITALRKEAARVVSGLGFKQGGASNSAFKKQNTMWDYMWKGFLGAVFGGLLGGLGMFIWKRRKGGNDVASGKPATAKEIWAEIINTVKGIFEQRKK